MKKIFLSIVAVILLLILLISVAWGIFGVQWLKGFFVETVYTQKHRELRFEGPFQLQFFPQPVLEVKGLHLSAVGTPESFLSLDRLKITTTWGSLFRGNPSLQDVQLDGVHLDLKRFADGHTNFEDLWVTAEDDAESSNWEIQEVTITSVDIHWNDELLNRDVILKGASFHSGLLAREAQGEFRLSGNIETTAPELLFRVNTSSNYILSDKAKSVVLEHFKLQLAGTRTSPGQTVGELVDFSLDVQTPVLKVSAAGIHSDTVKNSIKFTQGQLKGIVSVNLQGLGVDTKAVSLQSLSLGWELAGEAGFRVTGQVASPFHYDLLLQLMSLQSLKGVIEIGHGWLKKPLELNLGWKADVDFQKGFVQGQGKIVFDQSHFSGQAELSMQPVMRIQLNGALDRLNLDDYLAGDQGAVHVSKAGGGDLKKTEEPLGIELVGQLWIGELFFRNVRMESLDSRILFREGNLDIIASPASLQPEGAGKPVVLQKSVQEDSVSR